MYVTVSNGISRYQEQQMRRIREIQNPIGETQNDYNYNNKKNGFDKAHINALPSPTTRYKHYYCDTVTGAAADCSVAVPLGASAST